MNIIRRRLSFLFFFVGVLGAIIVLRLVNLQYVEAEKYAKQAQELHIATRVISAKRGRILDSGGDVLAISSESYRILAYMDSEDVSKTREILEAIKEISDFDVDAAVRKLIEAGQGNYAVIAEDIPKMENDLIITLLKQRGVNNVVMDRQSKRTYPFKSLSAHIIGLTNSEGSGYLGAELYYNDRLAGAQGWERRTVDRDRNPLPYGIHEIEPAVDGKDVYLTTKNSIQFFVEQAIKGTHEEVGAKSVSVLVTNVRDNSVLAIATYPGFSLGSPYDFGPDMDEQKWSTLTEQEKTDYYYQQRWRNRVVSTIYEPGSAFKTIITAIALEEGLITEHSEFVCDASRQVEDRELKCISYPNGHGRQTLEQAFVNSCNVAYMQISERIGVERLYKYFRKLHLFEPTGIDLPNESAPFYVEEKNVGAVELATLGYGHAISINMLNMVSAVSAIVNGGYYYPIYIARDSDGTPLRPEAGKPEKVFSAETCEVVKRLMTAQAKISPLKDIETVTIGGKSGTTVKFVDGEYDDNTVISSYIAFAPMENPVYCVYVLVDEPDVEKHGLRTAYPLVRRVFEDIFRLYSIDTSSENRQDVEAPQLVGGTLEWAAEVAGWYGLEVSSEIGEPEADKEYVVIDQFPSAGTRIKQGSIIILKVEENIVE